ncbi:MAG: aminoglycoside phosphotransferase family protein [Rhodospirillales bacterium]|jgi:aminoglycoside phosphotransferase (APT) family kinase protein|nr:aminoglycoside phosphotransferase family protein [Rhodospirillales bacterium]
MTPDEIRAALVRLGVAGKGENPRIEALKGGVSSDIFRVDLDSGPVCIKRALPKLKVAADWRAPVERNTYEFEWMRVAFDIEPTSVPELLAADVEAGLFVMRFLDPERYPLWKEQLRDGNADIGTAKAVGDRLVRIHAATAGEAAIAETFPTDHIFHPIRLEPYLLATARAHPDHAAVLEELAETTLNTKKALVHGDVSPKNILAGPDGPVFLDAECAWYGDPAFDLAFCMNHLLLKCLWTPSATPGFLNCFDALAAVYLNGVTWEPVEVLERRVANLLPGLFLARVDGKSPVEYLTEASDKERVRRVAMALLADLPDRLGIVRDAWKREVGQ